MRRCLDDDETTCAASHRNCSACGAASRFASECFSETVCGKAIRVEACAPSGGFGGPGPHALIDVEGRTAHARAAAMLAHNIDDMPAQFLAALDGETERLADRPA